MKDLITKYRPTILKEVWGNDYIKERWEGYVECQKFPHSIFISGIYGLGKTTLASICCRDIMQLADPENRGALGANLRILGPSDYDYKHINESIICAYKFGGTIASLTVIFMDEVQRMENRKVQELFLKPVEEYEYVYFVFATAEIDIITPALLRRSTIFPLERPPLEVLVEKLTDIAQKEQIPIPTDSLIYLIEQSGRIPRDCLKNLECLYGCRKPLAIDVVRKCISANTGFKYGMDE